MMRRPRRAVIRAYRASGRMVGQTFHTGTPWGDPVRDLTVSMLTIGRWFAERNDSPDPQRRSYVRDCVREEIASLRALRAARGVSA